MEGHCGTNGFAMVFGLATIGTNGFTMVSETGNHWTRWFFSGFPTVGPMMEW